MAGFYAIFIIIIATVSNFVLADKEYGRIQTKPGKSCRDIYQMNPTSHGDSNYYVVMTNKPIFVYCDMTLECGGEKGWMRIADVNPSKGSCPNGWRKITTPVAACRSPNDNSGCFSAYFPTHNIPYSRVCGKLIGIQKGTPDGFVPGNNHRSIDGPYLDGISLTYGSPRKHIWSFAGSPAENNGHYSCPCSRDRGTFPLPFVREHYYCESGNSGSSDLGAYFTHDPLWDGKGCGSENTCCVDPSLPWFFRQIPLETTDDIEMRICCDQQFYDEGIMVKETGLYVQ